MSDKLKTNFTEKELNAMSPEEKLLHRNPPPTWTAKKHEPVSIDDLEKIYGKDTVSRMNPIELATLGRSKIIEAQDDEG